MGIRRHALFLTQRGGVALPNGLEALSGFVLDGEGLVHGHWLDWNDERQAYTLVLSFPVEDSERGSAQDADYHAARRALHLSP